MTERSHGTPGRAGCPDPEQLAAHAEGSLAAAEAAWMDEHIAGCAACFDVFAETLRLRLESPADVEPTDPSVGSASSLAAADLQAGRRPGRGRRRGPVPHDVPAQARGSAPATALVAPLAKAMGARRFIEPRVTGGFQHGRLVVLRSGDAPQGLDAQPPAVLAAVAQIRERAEADTSPETLGAVAVTYLVSGDAGAAVKALESATAQAPDERAPLERPRRGLPRPGQPARRARGHPEGARSRGAGHSPQGSAARGLVQPRPGPRVPAPRRRRPQGLGGLPPARRLLRLGRRSPPASRSPPQGAPVDGRRGPGPRPSRPRRRPRRRGSPGRRSPQPPPQLLRRRPPPGLGRGPSRRPPRREPPPRARAPSGCRPPPSHRRRHVPGHRPGPRHSAEPGPSRTRRRITRPPASPGPGLCRPQGSQAPLRPPGVGLRAVPWRRPRSRQGAEPLRGMGQATGRRRLLLLLGSDSGDGRTGPPGARRRARRATCSSWVASSGCRVSSTGIAGS